MQKTCSILLAEASFLLREKLAGILSRSEDVWCVIQVADWVGLLRGAADLQPDLILVDIGILREPKLVAQIRGHSAHSRIVALVETDAAAYQETAARLKLDGVLVKALVADKIADEIRRLCEIAQRESKSSSVADKTA